MTTSISKRASSSRAALFKKTQRLIVKFLAQDGRAGARGRTCIPRTRIQPRVRARRPLASTRRATSDSGGDDDGGSGDPEPPRPGPDPSPICGGIAPRMGGAL